MNIIYLFSILLYTINRYKITDEKITKKIVQKASDYCIKIIVASLDDSFVIAENNWW